MNATVPAIETRALRKSFGDKLAVQDLTLTVERGEVFGFLGPNGAGKTTSVKMLLTLITPTGGEGRLFGAPLTDPGVRRRVGFLPEHFRFHDWLTASEFLALHADLYHMPRERAASRSAELLDLVGGIYDKCSSSLLYDDGKGVRTLLLTTIGLGVNVSLINLCYTYQNME